MKLILKEKTVFNEMSYKSELTKMRRNYVGDATPVLKEDGVFEAYLYTDGDRGVYSSWGR